MKFRSALLELEHAIIKLAELQNLFTVISNGIEESDKDEIVSSFYFIEDNLVDISSKLNSNFQILFDALNTESEESDDNSTSSTDSSEFL